MLDINLKSPEYHINRELSFLDFYDRVLAQAHDASFSLLERIRFLCISCSNLDEFSKSGSQGSSSGKNSAQLRADPAGRPYPSNSLQFMSARWLQSRINMSC